MYCACHAKSSWRLCVLLPHKRQPRPSDGDAHRNSSWSWRLCVLRLPHKRQPRPSGGHRRRNSSRACHAKFLEALCTAPATRKVATAQRRPRAPQLVQEALCTAPDTKSSRGPATATPAATPPGGSVYCACHTKGSRAAVTRAATPPGKAAALHLSE